MRKQVVFQRHRFVVLAVLGLLVATPGVGQSRGDRDAGDPDTQLPPPLSSVQPGRVADAGNGEVGQRQTREQAAPNINPLQRIESRIANRVQNRLRNRIDQNYDPQANAASPFRIAGDQARTAGRARRR